MSAREWTALDWGRRKRRPPVRHQPGCVSPSECGGVFCCPSCGEFVGFCCGGHDGHEELCDRCAAKTGQTEGSDGS